MSSNKVWRPAKVVSVQKAAADIMSIKITPKEWIDHKAGQHYEIRLPNHHLSRKYSIVSSPDKVKSLEFGIQILSYGEMSPRFWKLKSGDNLEIRGPLGAFVWTPEKIGPLVLVGAGSGITPLLSMYDHYKSTNPKDQVLLIVSAKNSDRIMHYKDRNQDMIVRLTEKDGRMDKPFLEKVIGKLAHDSKAMFLTCGPGGFTGHIISILQDLGIPDTQIRRETFS